MFKPHLFVVAPLFMAVGLMDYPLWSGFGKAVDEWSRLVHNLWSFPLGVTPYRRQHGYAHNVHKLCTGCTHSHPQLLYLFITVFKPFLSTIHTLHSPHNNNQFN